MNESLTASRRQLSELRDGALGIFGEAEKVRRTLKGTGPMDDRRVWSYLPEDLREAADKLASDLRRLMARVSKSLQGSLLLSEADFHDLGRHAKTMAAALRFRGHNEWSTRLLNDEDTVLGIQPAGQEEWELGRVSDAHRAFSEAYRAVSEMIDFWSPQDLNPNAVGAEVRGESVRTYRQNTAFLLMWINPEVPELDDVRDTAREVFKSFNIKATRADEIEHEGIITERIIQEISTSEFLFADLTGERPSVYYEVGFAHAVGKRVILFRKKGAKIHFDLAAYNCPEYENLGDLRRKLTSRLQTLTNRVGPEP